MDTHQDASYPVIPACAEMTDSLGVVRQLFLKQLLEPFLALADSFTQ